MTTFYTSAPTIADALEDAADLITFSWCRGNIAQDKHGNPVRPESDRAVKFSLPGALLRVATDYPDAFPLEKRAFRKSLRQYELQEWNDHQTKDQVLSLLRSVARKFRATAIAA